MHAPPHNCRRSLCQISHVLSVLPEPVFLIDRAGKYLNVWGGTSQQLHHDAQQLLGSSLTDLFEPALAKSFLKVLEQVSLSGESQMIEYTISPSDITQFEEIVGPKEKQYFSAVVAPFSAEGEVLWCVRNVTELNKSLELLGKQTELLEGLTNTDHLTQVFNRHALENYVPPVMERAKRDHASATIFMIDVDYFKQLNDHYGHTYGDKALRTIADCLKSVERKNGMCFRYGGDEFLLFFTHLTLDAVEEITSELSDKLEQSALVHAHSPISEKVTVTIGIEHQRIMPNSWELEELVQLADKALFEAKNTKRGSIKLNVN